MDEHHRLADFDRDGRLDLLVTGTGNNPNFQIVFGGPGGFTAGTLDFSPMRGGSRFSGTALAPEVLRLVGLRFEDAALRVAGKSRGERVEISAKWSARYVTIEIADEGVLTRARLEAARRRLEESAAGVDAVARECGFGSSETMRRSFLRAFHVGPSDYRRRFRAA